MRILTLPQLGRLLCLSGLIFALPPLANSAESGAKTKASATSAKKTAKIDINSADTETLQTLPGVGPATARAIIAKRPFASVAELESVPGIGAAKLADLRDHVTVSVRAGSRNEPAVAKSSDTKIGKSGHAGDSRESRSEAASKSVTKSAHPSAKIDVNTADATALETLPGIGASTARAIIAARPFSRVEDLERVSGIGAAKLADLRDHVTVSRQSATAAKSSSTGRNANPATSADSARSAGRDQSTRQADTRSERTGELEPTGRIDSPRTPAAGAASRGKTNLNTASREELEALPDIGPIKAQAIIEARPFSSVEDVMRVKGIKEGTFAEIKDRITVR